MVEKHRLSKIYYRNTKVVNEADRIGDLMMQALVALKYDKARCNFDMLRRRIEEIQNRSGGYDIGEVIPLMKQQQQWQQVCSKFAGLIGERVYEPLR